MADSPQWGEFTRYSLIPAAARQPGPHLPAALRARGLRAVGRPVARGQPYPPKRLCGVFAPYAYNDSCYDSIRHRQEPTPQAVFHSIRVLGRGWQTSFPQETLHAYRWYRELPDYQPFDVAPGLHFTGPLPRSKPRSAPIYAQFYWRPRNRPPGRQAVLYWSRNS